MSSSVKALVSTWLIIHLFCVFVALSSNMERSELQARSLRVLAPYTRVLNFEPFYNRYHLTHATPMEDDHVIEVEIGASKPDAPARVEYVRGGFRGGLHWRRYVSLSQTMAFYVHGQGVGPRLEEQLERLARSIGAHYLAGGQDDRVVVRCRRFQPAELGRAPAAPPDRQDFEVAYEADVWRADDGSIQFMRRLEQREAAPPIDAPQPTR